MCTNRCAANCHARHVMSRRGFLGVSAAAACSAVLGGCGPEVKRAAATAPGILDTTATGPWGPASRCTPAIKVAFVRRKGEYGMRWPGQVYDGQAARKTYTQRIQETAKALNMKADIRPAPIYSGAEADEWIAQAKAAGPDGLLVVLLDRQDHAWPTANKAIDSGIPTVVYSPVGSSFTTNTAEPSRKTGAVIYSTDDFSQAAYGMKMLQAGTKMGAARIVVIHGRERSESKLGDLGIQLRHVPAKTFVDLYNTTSENKEMHAIADGYLSAAQRGFGASRQDVVNGARSYVVARRILREEEADGVTMDCLGALGPTRLSLPCLAWSRLNDQGIPAACEADLGAVASHVIVQYLFDRPGFQQDPVAETARKAIIGAHCSCPTRLNGFDKPPEPFVLRHHHAERDATAQTIWRVGQAVTSIDVLPEKGTHLKGETKTGQTADRARMIISSGQVLENVNVPPAGGCVVSVMVKFDGVDDVLGYPGFHQVFFYGNYRRHLIDFCRLYRIQPQVV